jgi:N utilization substance protein A
MISELKTLFDYYEKEKGIDREKMVEALSQALLAASKKSIGPARELRIDIDPDKGTIKAFAKLLAVETVSNPWEELSIAKARKIKKGAELGDEIELEVTPTNMGRIAAQTAKQTMLQRLRMAEKENLYEEFKDRTGDVVSGVVRRFEKSDVVIDLGKFEGIMPGKERVATEDYNVSDRMRFYVKAVEKDTGRGPEIILSRAHPNFVRRLFEFEVSEIGDRTVEIASISREAGYRTKVAVHSADEKVDPVGACVGLRGARVKNIVRELNNEKVDIIRWKSDPAEFVREALKPIKVISITVDKDKKQAHLTVSEEESARSECPPHLPPRRHGPHHREGRARRAGL